MKVRFVPSVEDYIYIASRLNETSLRNSFDRNAFTIFLLINAIGAPAFLLYANYVILGLSIFVINLAFYLFWISGMTPRRYRQFYEHVAAAGAEKEVEIEISPAGVARFHDGDSSLIAWKNVSMIEERPESIIFHCLGGGLAVRKAAFDSITDQEAFLALAEEFRAAGV